MMLDSLFLIGGGMTCAGLVALANPHLLGWRTRRDALVVLTIAAAMLGAAYLARLV
jgi:hypothetical protein